MSGRDLAFVAGFLIAGAMLYPFLPIEMEGASSAWRTLLAASRGIAFLCALAVICAICVGAVRTHSSAIGASAFGLFMALGLGLILYGLFWFVFLVALYGAGLSENTLLAIVAIATLATLWLVRARAVKALRTDVDETPRLRTGFPVRTVALALSVLVLYASLNVPGWPGDPMVHVHGRVVDQHGLPVADVAVHFSWSGPPDARTDADGRFEFEKWGYGATLHELVHPQLTRFVAHLPIQSERNSGREHELLFKSHRRFVDPPPASSGRPDAPRELSVWRADGFSADVVLAGGWSSNLFVVNGYPRKTDHGFSIECVVDEIPNERSRGSGTIRLRPQGGGGFRRASDTFPSEAPATGYDAATLELVVDASQDWYSSRNEPSVWYFRAGDDDRVDDQIHGVFSVALARVQMHRQRVGCRLGFGYLKRMRGGSRDLAVSPDREDWGGR